MAMQLGTLWGFLVGLLLIPWRILQELYWLMYPPTQSSSASSDSFVDRHEFEHYSQDTDQWWDPEGPFAMLRGANNFRIPQLVKTYVKYLAERKVDDSRPLSGIRVCDVGCGAGFAAEALAELGASVTAIDVVPELVKVAEKHWESKDHPVGAMPPEYLCTSAEKLLAERGSVFDLVVCFEVVDHVANMPDFVRTVSKLVRPGGLLVISTINRTLVSFLLTVIACEHILRVVPMDTHHYYRLVKPQELSTILQKEGFKTVEVAGSFPQNPFARRPYWVPVGYTGVTYSLAALKQD